VQRPPAAGGWLPERPSWPSRAGLSATTFASGRSGRTSRAEPTKTVAGLGTAAYSSPIGSDGTSTTLVLEDRTELFVTALTPLAEIEAPAEKLPPVLRARCSPLRRGTQCQRGGSRGHRG
jgi:hypothetical protein